MKDIIFVGGIHGVGKGTFCNLITKQTGIASYSSGKLLSDAKSDVSISKRTSNVNKNQSTLINALSTIPDSKLILDGHFCLIDKSDAITKIPPETFISINPKGIIVLYEDPEIIIDRIFKRDGIKHEVSLWDTLQKQEIEYSKEIGNLLGIDILYQKCGDNEKTAIEYIKNRLEVK